MRWTALTFAPADTAKLAAVWRSSCGVNQPNRQVVHLLSHQRPASAGGSAGRSAAGQCAATFPGDPDLAVKFVKINGHDQPAAAAAHLLDRPTQVSMAGPACLVDRATTHL
jgi:hypothetical protein